MSVYIVRHIETREFQGIFWGTPEEVWDCLDELGNPFGFEYAEIGCGAIYTKAPIGEGQILYQLSDEPEGWGELGLNLRKFEPSEVLEYTLAQQDTLQWRPFDAADEGVGVIARLTREYDDDADYTPDDTWF